MSQLEHQPIDSTRTSWDREERTTARAVGLGTEAIPSALLFILAASVVSAIATVAFTVLAVAGRVSAWPALAAVIVLAVGLLGSIAYGIKLTR
ncbi:hypothetical protein [Rhodococcoides kyotonense]|uniref:Uncharacterized protein n=1 Tax=Rhodococcoides kyotonense TaxID=398843 RepID=A0A239KBL8_9NOCA|nr:hypothetical protein [Rhodococcus kyotonensis]SNT14504.1 hypothetical protein SAMN05421642_11010 [Rhodococcus kyotonensis]